MSLNEKIKKLFSITETGHHGIKEEKIVSIEEKLGIRFPEVLRNYYLLFGKLKRLNINDEIFRIDDVFIEDNKFLIIGNDYYNELYGINLIDIKKRNPAIYIKLHGRDKVTKKNILKWYEDEKSIEIFLLKKIIDSGLDGGFMYGFYNGKHRINELNAKQLTFLNNELLRKGFVEIKNISTEDDKYYTIDYSNILYISKYRENTYYIDYGTDDKEEYKEIIAQFLKNGINMVKKKKNYSLDYEIYSEYIQGPMIRIYPGKYKWSLYKNNPKNWENTIYLNDNAAMKFTDLLRRVNKQFDIYGLSTEYNKNQINNLIIELSERLNKMKNERNFHFMDWKGNYDYYNHNNIEFRRYKKQIIKLFTDLIEWLKKQEGKTISILGI